MDLTDDTGLDVPAALSARGAALAVLLAVASLLVVAGLWLVSAATGLMASGVCLAGWSWLVLSEAGA